MTNKAERPHATPTAAEAPSPVGFLSGKVAGLRARGVLAVKLRDWPAAIASLKLVVALTPKDPEAQKLYAVALANVGQQRLAVDALLKCVEVATADIEAHCIAAELMMSMLDYIAAHRHLTRCMELDPGSQHPHGVRARVLLRKMQRALEERVKPQ